MNAATPLLEVRDLTVRHRPNRIDRHQSQPFEAVHGLSLALQEGEVLAVVGESGCGKSSFARALLGLLPASSGAVYFRGREIFSMASAERRKWQRQVQLIFQDPHSALSPRRTIRQTLEEALQQTRQQTGLAGNTTDSQAINTAMDELNLPVELLQRYPHQLSGGQKQRVALARALLCQPAAIIADEPLSALDVSEQARLIQLLRKLQAEKRLALLLIAHDLAMVQQLADRVAVMYLGRLVELAPAEQFFRSPAHPYSQALLRAARRDWSHYQSDQPVLDGEAPSASAPPPGCVFHTRCQQKLARCSRDVPLAVDIAGPGSGILHQVQCHLYPIGHDQAS